MEDITPGLLEKIQKQFYHDIEKSSIIKNFKKQAQRGKTSYSQANEVAQEIGKILAQSYSDNLSSDILPDGKMYYNIASRVLDPTLRELMRWWQIMQLCTADRERSSRHRN